MSGYAMVELKADVLKRLRSEPFANQLTIVRESPMEDDFVLVTLLSPALPMDCRGVQQLWIEGDKIKFKPDEDT